MALDSGFVGRPLIGRYRCRETHHHVRDLEDVCRGARGARVQLALPAVEKAMIATVSVCTLLVQPIAGQSRWVTSRGFGTVSPALAR